MNSTETMTVEFPNEIDVEWKIDLNTHSSPIDLDDLNTDTKVVFNDSLIFLPEVPTLHGPFKIEEADP